MPASAPGRSPSGRNGWDSICSRLVGIALTHEHGRSHRGSRLDSRAHSRSRCWRRSVPGTGSVRGCRRSNSSRSAMMRCDRAPGIPGRGLPYQPRCGAARRARGDHRDRLPDRGRLRPGPAHDRGAASAPQRARDRARGQSRRCPASHQRLPTRRFRPRIAGSGRTSLQPGRGGVTGGCAACRGWSWWCWHISSERCNTRRERPRRGRTSASPSRLRTARGQTARGAAGVGASGDGTASV